MIDFDDLADDVLNGHRLTADEGLSILQATMAELPDLVSAGARIRRRHFGMSVKLNYLVNLKSGLCPENCNYCSQALGSSASILKYSWLKTDEAIDQAVVGINGGASRVCLVASGRGPGRRDIDRVTDIVNGLKTDHPEVEVCACLGILKDGQADRLREAGADAYNHNINTAESHHEAIVTTHTYADRTATIAKAKDAGLSPCSGLLIGVGESPEQMVEAVFALRELDSESIPINFLVPFDGTPMEGQWNLTPADCLKAVALVRFACPDKEVRLAGGREIHLRSMQAQALHLANSIFLGDYLTAEGQAAEDDLALIRDNGFSVLGHEPVAEDGELRSATLDAAVPPAIRQRGPGTTMAANA
ncbi:biotin synthase BioB [Brevibacterium sp.]|uniref:biotin synthase BioB n=1 Tax=Brevibacterium sp. TaxID=1701 RepID=UPI00281281FB|nr:biotin synthase BioB [Brevibacterium sp.]